MSDIFYSSPHPSPLTRLASISFLSIAVWIFRAIEHPPPHYNVKMKILVELADIKCYENPLIKPLSISMETVGPCSSETLVST
jgi:hypothetical protein